MGGAGAAQSRQSRRTDRAKVARRSGSGHYGIGRRDRAGPGYRRSRGLPADGWKVSRHVAGADRDAGGAADFVHSKVWIFARATGVSAALVARLYVEFSQRTFDAVG